MVIPRADSSPSNLTPARRDLLVAAGEQEDFHSFFPPQQPTPDTDGSSWPFGCSIVPKGSLLGHGPHPSGNFSRAAERTD